MTEWINWQSTKWTSWLGQHSQVVIARSQKPFTCAILSVAIKRSGPDI